MALPNKILVKTEEVTLSDGQVAVVRGLSRSEAIAFAVLAQSDQVAAEIQVLADVFDVSKEDAEGFHDGCAATDVGKIMDTVYQLSGLTEDAGKE